MRPAALLTLALMSVSVAAHADQVTVVFVEDDEKPLATDKTLEAIRSQLGDLPVNVVVERHARFADLRAQLDHAKQIASLHRASGIFWVDADTHDTLLFLFEPDGQRLLLRRIDREADAEATMEEVANVAHAIVEALLEGRHVGMTAVELPRRAPVAPAVAVVHGPAPPPPAPRFSIAGDVGAVAESISYRSIWAGGTGVSLAGRLVFGLLARLRYTFLFPTNIGNAAATITLTQRPFDVLIGWSPRMGQVTLDVEAGGRLESLTRATISTTPDLVPAAPASSWAAALMADASVGWRFLPWLGAYFRGGAVVFLTNTTYSIGKTPFFSPDVARMRLEAGLTFVTGSK